MRIGIYVLDAVCESNKEAGGCNEHKIRVRGQLGFGRRRHMICDHFGIFLESSVYIIPILLRVGALFMSSKLKMKMPGA